MNLNALMVADEMILSGSIFNSLTKEERKEIREKNNEIIEVESKTEEYLSLLKLSQMLEETVIEDVRRNKYHFSGIQHMNELYGAPIIDDKYILCLVAKDWGELMAKTYPEEIDENTGKCLNWAHGIPDTTKVKIPDESLWVKATELTHIGAY